MTYHLLVSFLEDGLSPSAVRADDTGTEILASEWTDQSLSITVPPKIKLSCAHSCKNTETQSIKDHSSSSWLIHKPA